MAVSGYAGRFVRVDLTSGRCCDESIDEATLRQWIGGTALGARLLWQEVPAGVAWSDPENRLVIFSGPLGGARVPGAGSFAVVTKGPLTDGAACSQANGFFGAYLKFSGYDGVIVQGRAPRWLYLYVHDGQVELRDASHLLGLGTFETEAAIKKELGSRPREASVHAIGPAGENQVKFAAIVGDRGHVAGHNGIGAVMGSKRLKAFVAARGSGRLEVKEPERVSALVKELHQAVLRDPHAKLAYQWGTSYTYTVHVAGGTLPVKNLTTNLFPEASRFVRSEYGQRWRLRNNPCWACDFHHCHHVTVTDGPYAGFEGEEPDYEIMAAFGALIGQTDPGAATMLTNEADRLGLEGNETGWLIAWLMECFEKGIVTTRDLDGLEMTWGNVDAVKTLLHRIAHREGCADLLAEGLVRAARRLGQEALNCAVFVGKGHAPRGHDHRARWTELLDTVTSNTGTIETGPIRNRVEAGLPESGGAFSDPFSAEEVAVIVARGKGMNPFLDSLVICMFPTGQFVSHTVNILNAVTGWDITPEEGLRIGVKAVNLLRAFNLRHGLTRDLEYPSPRYASTPADGPVHGISIMPQWDAMLSRYYQLMGWEKESGRPLPQTLKALGLETLVVPELWPH